MIEFKHNELAEVVVLSSYGPDDPLKQLVGRLIRFTDVWEFVPSTKVNLFFLEGELRTISDYMNTLNKGGE